MCIKYSNIQQTLSNVIGWELWEVLPNIKNTFWKMQDLTELKMNPGWINLVLPSIYGLCWGTGKANLLLIYFSFARWVSRPRWTQMQGNFRTKVVYLNTTTGDSPEQSEIKGLWNSWSTLLTIYRGGGCSYETYRNKNPLHSRRKTEGAIKDSK